MFIVGDLSFFQGHSIVCRIYLLNQRITGEWISEFADSSC